MDTILAFYFDMPSVRSWGRRYRNDFNTAQPFRHVVIDDFLPQLVLDLLISELSFSCNWKLLYQFIVLPIILKQNRKTGTDLFNILYEFCNHYN